MAAIYVDGPPHDFPARAARDAAQQTRLEDLGWTVVRFTHDGAWREQISRLPSLFGGGR